MNLGILVWRVLEQFFYALMRVDVEQNVVAARASTYALLFLWRVKSADATLDP